ncbi:hypothetical protein JTB14_005174 [Gonioctena quinquepunctata]|nr:hypothetical protein JTB14_005174 [Gonioctena quinquepunctata]
MDFKDSTKILGKLTNYCIQYGGMIRIFTPPTKPGVMITDNKILEYIMHSDAATRKSSFYRFLKYWVGEGLMTREEPCFNRPFLLREYIKKMQALEDVLVEKLTEKLRTPSIDIFPLMKLFAMDVLCETAMGIELNCQRYPNNEYFQNLDVMCKILFERSTSSLKKIDFFFRFTELYRTQTKVLKAINDFHEQILQKKMDEYNAELSEVSKLSFLDCLLHSMKNDEKISEEDIKEEINTFMFGGHDTTAGGLAFTLFALAHHPDIQN